MGSSMCVGALGVMSLPLDGDVWLVGDAYVCGGCFFGPDTKIFG